MSKTRPTRRPPYRYAVTFVRRDGTATKVIGKNNRQAAKDAAVALSRCHQIVTVRLWKYDALGKPVLIDMNSEGSEHVCGGCLATIGADDGRLMYIGVPFCGACAPLVENQLLDGSGEA